MTAEPRSVRTEAETAIANAYEQARGVLPGGPSVKKARDAAFDLFRGVGLPSRRIEEWKYTDLRALMRKVAPPAVQPNLEGAQKALAASPDPLAGLDRYQLVLVDGFHFDSLSDTAALTQAGVTVTPLSAALSDDQAGLLEPGRLAARDIAVALNAALVTDGLLIVVPDGLVLDRPLEIRNVATGAGATSVRNVVRIGAGASVSVIETYRGPAGVAYQSSAHTTIDVAVGGRASATRLQADGDKAVHVGTTVLNVAATGEVKNLSVAAGSAVARSQIFLTTGGDHTRVGLYGANMIGGKQHIDATLLIDHALPGANTRVLYKSVVDGEGSGVFQGKIIVEPDAQKTDAKMMSQALLVSETAGFSAKPELEIYADDVQCGHGATSGQIDETQLFYLLARGIPRPEAERLLIEAFLDDAIDALGDEAVGDALKGVVSAWLEKRSTR